MHSLLVHGRSPSVANKRTTSARSGCHRAAGQVLGTNLKCSESGLRRAPLKDSTPRVRQEACCSAGFPSPSMSALGFWSFRDAGSMSGLPKAGRFMSEYATSCGNLVVLPPGPRSPPTKCRHPSAAVPSPIAAARSTCSLLCHDSSPTRSCSCFSIDPMVAWCARTERILVGLFYRPRQTMGQLTRVKRPPIEKSGECDGPSRLPDLNYPRRRQPGAP
jgi:hypothetical protein